MDNDNEIIIKYSFIEYINQYLKSSSLLKEDYQIEELYYLIKHNYNIQKAIFSIYLYINSGTPEYIRPELEDYIEEINNNKYTSNREDVILIITREHIDYVRSILSKKYSHYEPYIFDEHIVHILKYKPELFIEVLHKKLDKDIFYRQNLVDLILVLLVGDSEPAPCAKGFVKQAFADKFKDLPKHN